MATAAAAAETVASIASLRDGRAIDGSVRLRDSRLVSRDKWRGKQSYSRTSEPFSLVVAIRNIDGTTKANFDPFCRRARFDRTKIDSKEGIIEITRVDETIKSFVLIFDRSIKILWNEYLIATVSFKFQLVDGVGRDDE